MAIQKISATAFAENLLTHLIIDVRSPGEYSHAHIPGAINIPIFSDEERKIIGTAYKQQDRKTAIRIGLDFFGPKMKAIVEQAEHFSEHRVVSQNVAEENRQQPGNTVLLHCARGGMRSAAMAWLLDLYGFHVQTLAGGYKAYRNWVLQQFQQSYHLKIIGGYTGSGKTILLQELQNAGNAIVDLEGLANHKGSALGGVGKGLQPSQEMFENSLATHLHLLRDRSIYLEDESQRIGNLQIPISLWETIRNSPVYFFDIPFEVRLDYLTEEYGRQEKEKLVNAVMRIQKRLGGLDTKNAVSFLLENNFKEAFRILLRYYDKYYLKGLQSRDEAVPVKSIVSSTVDAACNAALLQNEI